MTKLKLLLATVALCGGLGTASASAMPIVNLAQDLKANVENVRWVCGPYRCWWRPGWGYYGYYRPYGFYRPWGWGYRRWGWGRPYGFYRSWGWGYRRWGYRPWGWRGGWGLRGRWGY
jgi:hypothetical protein